MWPAYILNTFLENSRNWIHFVWACIVCTFVYVVFWNHHKATFLCAVKRVLWNFVFAISVGLSCAHMNVCVLHVTKKKKSHLCLNTAIRRQHIELDRQYCARYVKKTMRVSILNGRQIHLLLSGIYYRREKIALLTYFMYRVRNNFYILIQRWKWQFMPKSVG